ncbi:glycine cleavage system protein GcvH [Alicyclobacillus mali]|uniref:Glycine cleavage system H protein n=1 Tax=Alicyclobacillus mali (ex Roth et al. 2021) TaxID=1123961 RepID=A0ABS0EZE0_9BACL|nr:glycine cleavage system protein GcvH [Alicyclobacillus mali (ex Roth et al. 2021)]MBF8376398.1 glycine cleavage system protein GcvH [Alicyclobacillus mali (ex Roth et al. 2021)]MCL6488912.1 glycine cleavage system protein GcvH [Alicyclobacillus mali (ex Roth et al. 2021)]
MNIPEGLKYSREHEWVRVEGSRAYIGITDYAQDELGDIVYVELPDKGAEVRAGDTFGTVESVKTVSDLYAPVSGRVVEVNESLADAPEKVNESPYEEAWMIVVEMSDPSELEALLDGEAYRQHIQG